MKPFLIIFHYSPAYLYFNEKCDSQAHDNFSNDGGKREEICVAW